MKFSLEKAEKCSANLETTRLKLVETESSLSRLKNSNKIETKNHITLIESLRIELKNVYEEKNNEI